MSLQPPKGSSNRNSVAAAGATAVIAAVDAVVTAEAKNATPNGRSAWCKSAGSPKPSKAAKR